MSRLIVNISLILIMLLLQGCKQEKLLTALDQRQANEVLSLLQQNNIAAEKTDQGKLGLSVTVSSVDFVAAVELLNRYHLPSAPRVEIMQAFPADALVASPQAEKARLISALEQRLEQSLSILRPVTEAKVHISYPLNSSNDVRTPDPVHVSALLTYSGVIDEAKFINEIKLFFKNSFSHIEFSNISVALFQQPVIQRALPTSTESTGSGSGLSVIIIIIMVLLAAGISGGLLWQRQSKKISPPLARSTAQSQNITTTHSAASGSITPEILTEQAADKGA